MPNELLLEPGISISATTTEPETSIVIETETSDVQVPVIETDASTSDVQVPVSDTPGADLDAANEPELSPNVLPAKEERAHPRGLRPRLVNVDVAPGLDRPALLLSACQSCVQSGQNVVLLTIDAGAVNSPRTCAIYRSRITQVRAKKVNKNRKVSVDGTLPITVPSATEPVAPSQPFRSLHAANYAEFADTLSDLVEEPVLPDLIVIDGFDFLFQNEIPERPLKGACQETVTQAGHSFLHYWLEIYAGISQVMGLGLWVCCSHGNDLVTPEHSRETPPDARIDRELFYRELRQVLYSRCPTSLRAGYPEDQSEGENTGDQEGDQEGDLLVALYNFAKIQGSARTGLPVDALDVAAWIENLRQST